MFHIGRNEFRPSILTFCGRNGLCPSILTLVGARFIAPSQVALCLLERLRHVCLIVLRIAETYLGLFWNCAIFVGAGFIASFQAAVNFGKIILPKIHSRLFRRPKISKTTSLGQEAHVITRADIVRRVRHQDNRMPLISQFAQQKHHLPIQARVQTRCRLI